MGGGGKDRKGKECYVRKDIHVHVQCQLPAK